MYKQPAEYITHSLSFSPDVTVSLSLFRIWFFTFRTHGNKTWNIFDVCTHSVNLMCVLGHFSALFCLAQSYWLNGGKSNHNGVYLLKPPRENTNRRRKNGKTITSNRIELNWIEPLNMKRSHVILCYAMLCCAEVVVYIGDWQLNRGIHGMDQQPCAKRKLKCAICVIFTRNFRSKFK